MYLNANSIILAIIGVILIFSAKRIAGLILSLASPNYVFTRHPWRGLFYVWPARIIGIICLTYAILIALSGPAQSNLKNARNQIALLEHGVTGKAEVTRLFYKRMAPAGWKIVYKFDPNGPVGMTEKACVGSAQGPRNYYASLSVGDEITVIYDPNRPILNCEIRCFLDDPVFRHTFKKVGKLDLLDRFRDRYELRDYSFEEWYRQQQAK